MMNQPFKIIHQSSGICLALFLSIAHAQVFEIQNGSKHYDAIIDIACEKDQCGAKAEVKLFKKGSKTVFQAFHSDEMTLYLDEDFKPSVNMIQLYGEQSPLIFDDFNFDGTEDLAIRNGNYGSYGGPVYDIYVFNQSKNQFVLSQELSVLTQENLGMFELDKKRKRIITFNKSGCCYHIRSEYQVVPRKGLLLVREFIEDELTSSGNQVKVTERQLINGKWKEKTKYYSTEKYYGQ
ncbi:FG-GAP repeat protein [Acinetobacter nematophilus]|uniref:FG-GAP repeat protein n=1 Tax=Acinetobacter nematophilus TaxID=2994642 RepID=A0A9X3DXK8_9GAMM|nr:FG-GAP repeat protein [Acinetobacter nematophilus]MCX5466799.1 FG-GAP repeat protein [Acinetobacter nematophilus]